MNRLDQYRVAAGKGQFDARGLLNRKGEKNHHPKAGQSYDTASLKDLLILAQNPPVCAKADAYWMLGSMYNQPDARTFSVQEQSGRYVYLLVDIDKGNKSLDQVIAAVRAVLPRTYALINSTSSAKPGDMKWHVTIPLTKHMPYRAFKHFQLVLFDALELQFLNVDRALARAAQLFFLPSKTADDSFYQYGVLDGETYAPGGSVLCESAAQSYHAEERERAQVETKTRKGIRGTHSIISWFNNHYSTEDLLEKFGYLYNGDEWSSPYQQDGSGDFSTMVREDDSWFSLSDSDDAAGLGRASRDGRNGDAFDLLKHYSFRNDEKAALKWVCNVRRRQNPLPDHIGQSIKNIVEAGQ